jgi:hypothetical protein
MAIRLDAVGEELNRTANLPTNTAFTYMIWSVLDSDQGAAQYQQYLFAASGDFTQGYSCGLFGDLFRIEVYEGGVAVRSGDASGRPTLGTPHCIFLRCSGTGANLLTGGYREVGQNAFTTAQATMGTISAPAAAYFGGFLGTFFQDGRKWNIKVWNRALSDAEILIESFHGRPQFPGSINFWWPLSDESDTADRSGNGRSATVVGSPTAGDQIASLWKPRQKRIFRSSGGAVDLTISEATHGHTADSLTLTTSITLVISDCTHGHTADSLTVSTGTLLSIAEASHAHTADALTLSTGTGLQIAEAAHGHTVDALSLTMDSTLAIADAAHAHTADNLTLGVTTGVDLVIADAAHAHSVDALALTLDTTLAIAEAQHAHSADGLVLSTDQHLDIQDATHAHSADNVVLSDVPTLSIADATHGHAADSLSLSTATNLSIADALHSHTAEQILLSTTLSLAIAEASHAHTADNLVLSDIPSLAIADSRHAHTADGLELTLDAWLLIADAVHAHLADSLTLSTDSEFERAPSGGGFRRPAVQSYRPARFSSTPRPTRSNTTRPSR